ncbi:MAG: LysE family transporter [Ignavibacteria bacterium]|nr:LysE family transporter [Ignavibacteria bacterium]
MLSIVPGIIVGILLALPPGPAALTAIKLGLSNSSRHGFLSGLGTAIMDFFYCLIAIFATSAIIEWASNFSHHYPVLVIFIQLLIVLMVISLGISHIKSSKKVVEEGADKSALPFIERLSARGPFFVGIGIALTNIINPTFLPSLGYVALNIQQFGLIEIGPISNFFFALGFGIGNLIWLIFLVKSFVSFKKRMSEAFLSKIHKFAGLTLIGFGTFLGYRVLEVVKWSEVLRFVFAF